MFLALASGKTSGLSNFVPGNLNVEDNFDYTTRCTKYRSTNLILKKIDRDLQKTLTSFQPIRFLF